MYDEDDEENEHRNATSGGGIGGIVGLVIFGLIIWWGYNHFIHKPTWTAVYYPSAANLSVFRDQSVGSLEECRDWVDAQAQLQGNTDYDYECGTDCKLQVDNLGKFYRCKETFE